MNIPDCYDPIYQAEQRAAAPQPTVKCSDCGAKLEGDDPLYIWDGDVLCKKCVKKSINECFTLSEIAEGLGIIFKSANDAINELFNEED